MNVLRDMEGGLRKKAAFMGMAGALAIGQAGAGNPGSVSRESQPTGIQKDAFLSRVAGKISKVILCLDGSNKQIVAYDALSGPAVMIGYTVGGRPTSYELSAVVGPSPQNLPDPAKTMAVEIVTVGPKKHMNLKMTVGNSASDGSWFATDRPVNDRNDIYTELDPMHLDPPFPLYDTAQQMQIARIAWQETIAAAHIPRVLVPGDNESCATSVK